MFTHFDPSLMQFLKALAANNHRDWFNEHKQRYEDEVRSPVLAFIQAMETDLRAISPHYTAIAKKTGGSMMRPYRDTRFGHDKSPYKTNVGIQFRHEAGKDVHAPGFYLHISPDDVFVGVGVWHPDSSALGKIRDRLAENPGSFKDVLADDAFSQYYQLSGDSLTRPPRGYDKELPLIEHIKRKDFIAICHLDESELYQPGFTAHVSELFESASPFQGWLCAALGLRY